jgi:hypothetical protein
MPETKHEGPEVPEEARKMVTISLKEMAQRYLGALQRSFDVAAMVVQGTREVNERGYDELIASSRFLPNREKHRSFGEAKAVAERWILRNLLSDAFGAVVPFLEDARTICALDEWKKAGSDQATLPPIFTEQRQKFVGLDTKAKLNYLQATHGLQFRLADHLAGIESLAACLIRNDGVVPGNGGPLTFTLISLDLIAPASKAEAKIEPQLAETKKEFAAGSTVALEKVEYMNLLATIALFMNDAMRLLQARLASAETK